jgi:hypothetical protein
VNQYVPSAHQPIGKTYSPWRIVRPVSNSLRLRQDSHHCVTLPLLRAARQGNHLQLDGCPSQSPNLQGIV